MTSGRKVAIRRGSPLVLAALAFWTLPTSGVTKHFSFSNGYPTTTPRTVTRAAGATVGPDGVSFGSGSASRTKRVEERDVAGTVVEVEAGGILWVAPSGGRRTKVVLADVGVPVAGQPQCDAARKFLADLVRGKRVTVHPVARARSGTVLGTVFLKHEKGLVDVNLTLIRNGFARYKESAREVSGAGETSRARAYAAGDAEARTARRGLWADAAAGR